MRRLCALSAVFFLCAGIFLGGCRSQNPKNDDDKKRVEVDPNKVKIDPLPVNQGKNGGDKKGDPKQPIVASDDKQEKYEAALADALSALAERKWSDALEAFETAKTFQDTEFVKAEIAKLKE